MCTKRFFYAIVMMIPVWMGMLQAQDKAKLSVAALNLPPGGDGLLHWRDGNKPTEPIQLSIRYFSDFLTLESGVLRLYTEPVIEDPKEGPPVKPLYTQKMPPGQSMAFLVLTSQQDGNDFRWRGQLIPGKDLKMGSIKIFNATEQELGVQVPGENHKLLAGKHMDLDSRDHRDSFPVKIYQLGDDPKKIFSSVWRISPQRREVCFVYKRNRSLKLRSLLFLAPAQSEVAP